jgi:hypothetical protein
MALPTVRGQLMNFSRASVSGLTTGKSVSKAMRVHQNLHIQVVKIYIPTNGVITTNNNRQRVEKGRIIKVVSNKDERINNN